MTLLEVQPYCEHCGRMGEWQFTIDHRGNRFVSVRHEGECS